MSYKRNIRFRHILISVLAIIITLCFLIPIIWAVMTAFKFQKDIFTYPPRFIFTPTLDNFKKVLNESDYLKYMFNSITVSSVASAISVFIGTLAAYAFSNFYIKGSKNILLWVLSLRMIPAIAVVVPFYLMSAKTGLYDTRFGLMIVLTVITLPIALWLQMSFIRGVPQQIIEAATIDGCSHFGAFMRVVLPLEITGIITTFIICIIFAWNELPLSLLLAPQNAQTLPVSMLSWNTQRGLLWGPMMAAGTMSVIPIILFGLFAQKYIVRGLTLGAMSEE